MEIPLKTRPSASASMAGTVKSTSGNSLFYLQFQGLMRALNLPKNKKDESKKSEIKKPLSRFYPKNLFFTSGTE
jgi:hypothetical protein